MKTKTKATKIPAPVAVGEGEPTDDDLRAIETESANISEQSPTPLVASATIDLARLGLGQIAYVRRTIVDDEQVWAIHSAAGHPLGAATTLEQAWGAIVQNELQPVHVH